MFKIVIQVVVLFFVVAASGFADEVRFSGVGVRGGVSANGNKREDFLLTEGFTTLSLPWTWGLGKGWSFKPAVEGWFGYLGADGGDAFETGFGPTLALGRKGLPVYLEGGLGIGLMSRHDFDTVDVGSILQFSGAGGVFWRINQHFTLGYRYEHISNGGIAAPNPGLNFHTASLSYRF